MGGQAEGGWCALAGGREVGWAMGAGGQSEVGYTFQ